MHHLAQKLKMTREELCDLESTSLYKGLIAALSTARNIRMSHDIKYVKVKKDALN